jgi:hypothetical protein
MDQSWKDPTTAWWTKAARASMHIREVGSLVDEFEFSKPYRVCRENTKNPSEVAFRFKILRPIPTEILTAMGDAIHNMRSALDAVAYELARQYLNDEMTDKRQAATQFPICETGEEFDEFFANHRYRRDMYGEQEKKALRCVQPFALREEAAALGVDFQTDPHIEYVSDELHRLHSLSIVDKHRRLPLLAWYLAINYWNDPNYDWRFAQHPYAEFKDKALIGYLTSSGGGLPEADATFDFKLFLADDPGFRQDLKGVLTHWHDYLTNWVIPRVFVVAEGNPPPIVFMRG